MQLLRGLSPSDSIVVCHLITDRRDKFAISASLRLCGSFALDAAPRCVVAV
jgi:hypothetical protein